MTRNPNIRLELPYSSETLDLIISAYKGFGDYSGPSRAVKELKQNGVHSVGKLTLRLDRGILSVNFNGKRSTAERLFEQSAQIHLYVSHRVMAAMNAYNPSMIN